VRRHAGDAPIVVVVGPTAVGKSEFALQACERFDGELISVDSIQVYRGLDVGTSKPSPDERCRAAHHGIDLADPRRDFSLGDFVRAAVASIASVRSGGRLAVLVGGTGLYLRGVLKGIIDAPRRDETLRRRLRALARRRGADHLHRMLARVDPPAAARLSAADRQRVVRALEVFFASRRGLSEWINERPFGADRYRSIKVGLSMEREVLYRRIDARVQRYFDAGLIEEVRGLLASGVPMSANAFKALGYREVLAHLNGEIALPEAIALTQRNSRRYAKRQWTWFRKEEAVAWFEVDHAQKDCFRAPLAHVERALSLRGDDGEAQHVGQHTG
jgi:tRNA dimethylallyltransferase